MTTQSKDHAATREELVAILSAAAGVPAATLNESPDASLADLGLDSLAALELQAAVQDRYQVRIPDDALDMSMPEITRFVVEQFGREA